VEQQAEAIIIEVPKAVLIPADLLADKVPGFDWPHRDPRYVEFEDL
jgi:hypothetical protein